jgi:hypothetical protein
METAYGARSEGRGHGNLLLCPTLDRHARTGKGNLGRLVVWNGSLVSHPPSLREDRMLRRAQRGGSGGMGGQR